MSSVKFTENRRPMSATKQKSKQIKVLIKTEFYMDI